MIKRIAASLCIALAAACASTPMTSSETAGASGLGQSVRLSNAPHYIALSAPSQVVDWDFSNTVGVRGFYLRGTLTNRGFLSAGPIQGNGKFCADGKDWYSLSDLKAYKAGEKTPTGTYVLGCATSNGFQPASRDIVTQ